MPETSFYTASLGVGSHVVTFTAAACDEIRRRIATFGERQHVVQVMWLPAQVDLIRSDAGDAIWKEVRPAEWAVSVSALPVKGFETEDEKLEWPEEHLSWLEERLVHIGEFRVYFAPEGSGTNGVTVGYIDGEFLVESVDA